MNNLFWMTVGLTTAFFFGAQSYFFCAGLALVALLGGTYITAAFALVLFVSLYSAVEPDFIVVSMVCVGAALVARRYFVFLR